MNPNRMEFMMTVFQPFSSLVVREETTSIQTA